MQNDDFVKDENQISGGDTPENLTENNLSENLDSVSNLASEEPSNVTNEVTNNLENDGSSNGSNNDNKKNNKMILIIVGVVLAVLVLAVIGSLIYVKFMFTAPKYIDEKIADFSTSVDEMFSDYSLNTDSDSIMTGDFTLSTDVSELASLNGTTVNFNMGYSAAKEIIDLNLELLSKDNSLLTAEAYINDSAMYLNSEDLYPQTLYTTLEDNPFAQLNSEEYQAMMSISNYKEFIINFVKYVGTAIKEADVTSSINGLTALYTYELNDGNKKAFADKLNELIDNDTTMKEFLQVMLDSETVSIDPESIPNMILEVEVHIPSGDLKSFEFTTDEMVISANETDDGVYDVKIDDTSVMTVTVDGDNVRLVADDDVNSLDITFNTKEYTMDGTMSFDGNSIDIAITNSKEDTKKIVLEMNTIDEYYGTSTNLVLDCEITSVSENEANITGSANISSSDVSMELGFNVNSKIGNDLVSEKQFSNLKDINTFTTADEDIVMNNLYNILMEFSAVGV